MAEQILILNPHPDSDENSDWLKLVGDGTFAEQDLRAHEEIEKELGLENLREGSE